MPSHPIRYVIASIFRSLLDGDPRASWQLLETLWEALIDRFRRLFPHADEQLLRDGIEDAVRRFCEKPQSYEPGKNVPLDRYLAGVARRRVRDLLRAERRHHRRVQQVARTNQRKNVELSPLAANILQEEKEALEVRWQRTLDALPNERDRQLYTLLMRGERKTAEYARVLDILDLPLREQRREVKRHKDRLKQYGRRHGLLPPEHKRSRRA